MHELSIAQDILKIAEKEGRKHGLKRIRKINLKIGVLKGVVRESLVYSFRVLARGTRAGNARLSIRNIPLIISCTKCGKSRSYHNTYDFQMSCFACASTDVEIVSGKELYIDSIEGE